MRACVRACVCACVLVRVRCVLVCACLVYALGMSGQLAEGRLLERQPNDVQWLFRVAEQLARGDEPSVAVDGGSWGG